LAKLRKPLQQKLKKDVMWTWTTNDSKIFRNFKKMCENLPVINLPYEGNDLSLEIDTSNEHWCAVLKIKEERKLCKYYSGSFNKTECNYPMMEKGILTVIRGNEKFLIFLAPKPFLI